MASPEPFRGEVWDVRFLSFGEHPAVVLSINALSSRLGHVAVIPVTGTAGPALTRLPLSADVGLTRYEESYADITGLRPVARGRLLRRRGRLTQGELRHLEDGVRTYLGM
jgi:mRNA interferase MazF